MGIAWIDPVDIDPPFLAGYQTYDVSAQVSDSAVGALVRVKNNSVSDREWGLRPSGSAATLEADLDGFAHAWDFVGLDENKTFEVFRESSFLSVDLYGEFSPSARFFAEPVQIPVGGVAFFSYGVVDISPFIGNDTAVAAFLVIRGSAPRFFARPIGSAYDLTRAGDGRQTFIAPVDANGQFELYRDSALSGVYLVGYDTQGFVFPTETDISPATDDVWESVALPAGATGALVWSIETGGDTQFGVRRPGSAVSHLGDMNNRASYALAEASAEAIEVFREATND